MITLYLVRHGETTYNREGRIQGHDDAPLTALGIRQAGAVADRLSRESIAAIYSSDLGRARMTAESIAACHNLPVNATPLLRESNLGVLQGLTRAEIDERYPASENEWRRDMMTMRPPGAETIQDVIDRGSEFLRSISGKHEEGESLVIVGHGGSLRGLVIAACALPSEFYRGLHFANAGLSILNVDAPNRYSIRLLNDTCHLDSLATDGEEVDSKQ